MQTDIHACSGIRTHADIASAGEDSSRLRPPGHCDWQVLNAYNSKITKKSSLKSLEISRILPS
jgi:hypothetical protein